MGGRRGGWTGLLAILKVMRYLNYAMNLPIQLAGVYFFRVPELVQSGEKTLDGLLPCALTVLCPLPPDV